MDGRIRHVKSINFSLIILSLRLTSSLNSLGSVREGVGEECVKGTYGLHMLKGRNFGDFFFL